MTTKQFLAVFLLLVILAGTAATVFMFMGAKDAELRRKRNNDAYEISDALIIHMHEHNGALPSSLLELEFRDKNVDSSPFNLLPPGTQTGQRNQDVIAEAQEGGRGKYKILIYADGVVRWE